MRQDEMLLRSAINELRASEPDAEKMAGAARRVGDALGIDRAYFRPNAIDNCGDVRLLRGDYRGGNLSHARSLVIKAHLQDCSGCRRHYGSASATGASELDWSAPRIAHTGSWRPRTSAWILAPTFALLIIGVFFYRAFWQVPPGVRAEVQSIDGAAYRISDTGDRPLAPGDTLQEGESLRTGGGAHAVLRLADGSSVELNERTVLAVGARGRDATIALNNGAVIVQAAKRTSGHLYVKTADCRVAVTGTVFSVDSGIKGSRVAVLEGSLHVIHAGTDTFMHAGDQVSTSDNLASEPVSQQIAWSRDREKYLLLLGQFNALQQRIDQISMPQLRYSSDLLPRVPAGTLLYISIPNLGDFLSQASTIFHDQLQQSAALRQWWNSGRKLNSADLDAQVETLHQISRYLGSEVVIVGLKQTNDPGFAIIADVQKAGLGDFLKAQYPSSSSTPGFIIFDEASLAGAPGSSKPQYGQYALIRQHEAVFSNNIGTLRQVDAQLTSGASGFATGAFGQQITSAYARGAGVILAANLQQILLNNPNRSRDGSTGNAPLAATGIDGVQYLIAEHRELNGLPENHLDLQFAGARQGVASWLAAPAPMGSFDFVTPNASMAVAFLSKDPAAIVDDIMSMAARGKSASMNNWSDMQDQLQINIRNDIAANLGGEFLVSFDGPVLPTPAWKVVTEVRNSDQLEKSIERLADALRGQNQGKQSISITSSLTGGQTFYTVRDTTSGVAYARYTYADGYMIMAPDQALLTEALHAHASGASLGRSAAFKALLPVDGNANYSAIAYQNISPVLSPLLSQFGGPAAEAIQQLSADARPTAICLWGNNSGIEAASNSRLFGFDFFALPALLKSGNQHANASVRE